MTNARNLANLLGGSTTVPTTALPTNIQSLDVAEIPVSKLSLGSNTLTQSFDSNQSIDFNLTDSVSASIPIVSAFKEIPQPGVISKGRWDVNANATNYEFFDEKPISYSSANLTPSATGDGTFTNSAANTTYYDVANATYDNVSNAQYTQLTGAYSTIFNNNGTKAYVTATYNNGSIFQYSLSTAYDVSTNTYDSKTYAFSEFTYPTASRFNGDGTKLYTVAWNGAQTSSRVYQYTLSTAYDISTASYDSVNLDMTAHRYAWGFTFNNDGSKVFVSVLQNLNLSPGGIAEYSLSTNYNLSTAGSETLHTLSGSGWNHYGIEFNNDGTKLFVNNNDDVPTKGPHVFTLSTAYDISTTSYTSTNADVNALYGSSMGAGDITFNNDGSKMYISDTVNGYVRQFSVFTSTAFNAADVGKKVVGNSGSAIITSTAGAYKSVTAFADTSAISSWQLFGAQGKADGSGIELSGYGQVYDLANGSFTTLSSHLSQNEGYQYMHFKPDGTKVWVGGQTSDTIFEYDIGTAFDLSTISYGRSKAFSTSTQSRGFFFKPDGTRAYISDRNNYIRQLNMNTAWDISTAQSAYGEYNMNTSTQGIFFKPDGTKFYNIDDGTGRELKQFSMSTAWDITTASLDHTVNLPADQGVSNQGVALAGNDIWFSSDGTYFFLPHGNTGNPVASNSHIDILKGVAKFSLSTAWDISSTITYLENIKQVDQNGAHLNWTPSAVNFNSDGSKMYTIVSENSSTSPAQRIMEFSTGSVLHTYSQYMPALTNSSNGQINSSAWLDINSMTADETKNNGDIFYAVSTDNRTSWAVAKASDGARKIAKNNSGTWQYNNNGGSVVGYGLANETYDNKNFDTTADTSEEAETSIAVSSDGTKFYITGYQQQRVWQFNMSTPFDLSTGVYNNVSYTLTGLTHPWGLFFKPDGTKMYVLNPQSTATISEYALSTAWDVSTASHTATENYPAGPTYESNGLFFKSDGSKVYILRYDSTVYSWNLTTPWDITTGSYIGVTSAFLNSNSGRDILFNDDGLKMYLLLYDGSPNTYYIREYDLSTAWDPNTASYNNISFQPGLDLGGSSTTITAMCWANSGKKLYVTKSKSSGGSNYGANSFTTTTTGFGTSETWVNGTTNNEHATLQQALGAQAFNRMNKAQLDAVADGYHFSQDSADTLDLMIAPYATSGTSPISDGVTINYDAEAIVREAVNGTDYVAEFPQNDQVKIKSLIDGNLKIRII